MQELYYTPDVTDFRVGFECEIRDPDYQGQADGIEWKPMSADRESIAETLKCWKHFQEYRVPYLTGDILSSLLIEEGWDVMNHMQYSLAAPGGESFEEYILTFYEKSNSLFIRKVWKDRNIDLYNGPCRCINEFRLIYKILGIK